MTDELRPWVEGASRGDAAAVDELFAAFLPGLEHHVRRRLSARVAGKESASDLVQSVCRECLERLADGRFEYRGEGPFREWLYRAATMKIMNRHRHWVAGKRAGSVAPEEDEVPDGAASATPSGDAERREELDRLERALVRLPDNYREILDLVHAQGLSHREAGERLGITEAHSRVLFSRALARLCRLAGPGDGAAGTIRG